MWWPLFHVQKGEARDREGSSSCPAIEEEEEEWWGLSFFSFHLLRHTALSLSLSLWKKIKFPFKRNGEKQKKKKTNNPFVNRARSVAHCRRWNVMENPPRPVKSRGVLWSRDSMKSSPTKEYQKEEKSGGVFFFFFSLIRAHKSIEKGKLRIVSRYVGVVTPASAGGDAPGRHKLRWAPIHRRHWSSSSSLP